MDELSIRLKTVQRVVIFFLSFCFLAWAVIPGYRPLFAGWIIGTAVSMLNARYLAWKIRTLSDAALEGKRRRGGLGFGTRAAIAVLAIWAVYKFPEHVSIWTTVTGLIFVQLATLLLGIISLKK